MAAQIDNLTCSICNVKFSKNTNLRRHQRTIHKIEPGCQPYDINKYLNKCLEGCEVSFRTKLTLLKHLRQDHEMVWHCQRIYFNRFADYLEWKEAEEEDNRCQYVQDTAEKPRLGEMLNKSLVLYLHCNRSGYVDRRRIHDDNRQRLLKLQGASKLGYACTSFLKVTCKADSVEVLYCKTHYGHMRELQHLRISRLDKNWIVGQIKDGVGFNQIIRTVEKGIGEDGMFKRLHFLTRDDMNNIMRAHNKRLNINEEDNQTEATSDDDNNLKSAYTDTLEDIVRSDFCLIVAGDSEMETSKFSTLISKLKKHMNFVDIVNTEKDVGKRILEKCDKVSEKRRKYSKEYIDSLFE